MKTIFYCKVDEESFRVVEDKEKATHKGYVIEKSDMCNERMVAFRSDLRPPKKDMQAQEKGEIFTTGFEFRANDSLPKMMMRKCLATKVIDILRGISLCRKTSKAAYFPANNQNGLTYVYAAYVSNYFDASEFEKKHKSPQATDFSEILCEQIAPSQIVAAFACQIQERKFEISEDNKLEIVRYKIINQELIWNELANEKAIPDFDKYKKNIIDEFLRLKNYSYLEIRYYASGLVKVAGEVPAKPSPVIANKPDPQQQLFNKVVKEMSSYSQEIMGFEMEKIKGWKILFDNQSISIQNKIAGMKEFVKGMEKVKQIASINMQQKIGGHIKNIQAAISSFEAKNLNDTMPSQVKNPFN